MAENKTYIYEIIVDTKKGTASINGTAVALDKLEGKMQKVATEAKKLGKNMGQAMDKTGLAGAAVVELGRTVSDVNYGFTAMANNISQLGTLMATLVATSGGLKQGLGAMLAVMRGPLGIIFAFQILVALLEKVSMEARKSTASMNDLAKAYKNAGLELEIILKHRKEEGTITDDEIEAFENRITLLKEEARIRALLSKVSIKQGEIIDAEQKKVTDYVAWWQKAWMIMNVDLAKVYKDGIHGMDESGESAFSRIITNFISVGEPEKQKVIGELADELEDIMSQIDASIVEGMQKKKGAKDGKAGPEAKGLYGMEERGLFGADEMLRNSIGVASQEEIDIGLQRLLFANEVKIGMAKETAKTEAEIAAKAKADREADLEHRMIMLDAIGGGLQSLGFLIGKETQAGKAVAAAGALIDTYAAISKTLRAFSGKPIPGYAIAQAVATGLFGFAQVKKIYEVNVPKGGGSGAGSGAVPSDVPIQQPDFNIVGVTRGNQIRDTIQSALGKPIRAYVTTKDIRSGEELDRNIVRGATVG